MQHFDMNRMHRHISIKTRALFTNGRKANYEVSGGKITITKKQNKKEKKKKYTRVKKF